MADKGKEKAVEPLEGTIDNTGQENARLETIEHDRQRRQHGHRVRMAVQEDAAISHIAVARLMSVPRVDPQIYDLLFSKRQDFSETRFCITVTKNSKVIKNWVYRNLKKPRSIVGINVQWDRRNPSAADTLQLCIGTESILIQLSTADDVPPILRSFLMHRRNKFIGIGDYLNGGQVNLGGDHNLVVRHTVNLALGETIPGRSTVENIAKEVLGMNIRSGFSEITGVDFWRGMMTGRIPEMIISDWSKDFLYREQVQFSSIASAIFQLVGVKLQL